MAFYSFTKDGEVVQILESERTLAEEQASADAQPEGTPFAGTKVAEITEKEFETTLEAGEEVSFDEVKKLNDKDKLDFLVEAVFVGKERAAKRLEKKKPDPVKEDPKKEEQEKISGTNPGIFPKTQDYCRIKRRQGT